MKSEALIGRTIAGKYRIETLVGQGAMGCVYRVRQLTLDTTLALKVLHRQLAGEPMFAARFLREAQAASRVDHPSSIRVLDFGEEPDGLLYIAMEFVDGKTLARIIEDDAPLPVARIVDIAGQALAALAVAHDLGVVHRDLKPENIMVQTGQDDEGRTHDLVKVCDFGVAKLLESGARGPGVTAQGVVVGTPEYMSPEQARGEDLDARSDIYAMGVLLFQMMTGQVPFDSSTAFGTLVMHVNDEPTRPRLLNPNVSARLEAICLKAMRKRPDDRHASARELRAELRTLIEHDEEKRMNDKPGLDDELATPPSLLAQIESRPRRSGLAISAVVVAGTLLAGAYLYHQPSGQPVVHEPVQSAPIASAAAPPVAHPAVAPEPAAAAAPTPGAEATSKEEAAVPARGHGKANARRSKGATAHGTAVGPSIAIGEEAPAADAKPDAKAPAADAKPDAKAPEPRAAKPAAKPDPADAPLPVFPVPSTDPPPPKPAPAAPPAPPAPPSLPPSE